MHRRRWWKCRHEPEGLGGDSGKSLTLFHDIQVVITLEIKDLHDRIQHFTVLTGQTADAFQIGMLGQLLDKRRHFDGFRSGAENGHNFNLFHDVLPLYVLVGAAF